MSIEGAAGRYVPGGDAEHMIPQTTFTGSRDSLLCPVSTQSMCGPSLMIAVNAGMFAMVAAVAFAVTEIVAHLAS